MDLYIPPNPKHQDIDGKLNTHKNIVSIIVSNSIHVSYRLGSHFGTTFPHLFLQTFPDIAKKVDPITYTARLFGFRIHSSSLSGPRMQWLRTLPNIEQDNDTPKEKNDPLLTF